MRFQLLGRGADSGSEGREGGLELGVGCGCEEGNAEEVG